MRARARVVRLCGRRRRRRRVVQQPQDGAGPLRWVGFREEVRGVDLDVCLLGRNCARRRGGEGTACTSSPMPKRRRSLRHRLWHAAWNEASSASSRASTLDGSGWFALPLSKVPKLKALGSVSRVSRRGVRISKFSNQLFEVPNLNYTLVTWFW